MDNFDPALAFLFFLTSTNGVIIIGMGFIIWMGRKAYKAYLEQEKMMNNMGGERNV